jgi:hydrogenase maturation factor HypF (carbamoyltransferase family)
MPECSICNSAITNRQEVFQSPACIESHTVHKACLDPRYTVEPSSCPTCQAVAHSVQQQEAVAPVISHQIEHPQTPESVSNLNPF